MTDKIFLTILAGGSNPFGRTNNRYCQWQQLPVSADSLKKSSPAEDIKALIAANRQALKMDEVREYFRLFNREALLEEILK